jgi:hypothetical protein
MLSVCLGGCLSGEQVNTSKMFNRPPLPRAALGPDGVMLDYVLVERPLGDPFLNDELWETTDVQVVGVEKKRLLEDNGIRVGQVIGMNPAKLQNLLESERFCVSGRRQILAAGALTTVPLGPVQPTCDFSLRTGEGSFDVTLDQAQCTLAVVPMLTDDGRTRVKFTPQIVYGAQVQDYQVAPGRTGWEYEYKRQSKSYDALSWEITLAPNQQVLIGTFFDPDLADEDDESLGNQCFIQDNGKMAMQRLLVIRTTRGSAAGMPGQGAVQALTPAAACMQLSGQ